MIYRQQGFTIVELVATMVTVIIVLFLGIPSLKEMSLRTQMTTHLNEFIAMQRTARQLALFNKTNVTFCASIDGNTCISKKYWSEGALVFIDHDGDHKLDSEDKAVRFFQSNAKELQVTWRAFQNKSYLQFGANGWTNNQNGTFRFCFKGESARFNRAVIITKIGRARLSTDVDGDGFHEDGDGEIIEC
ncbi:GspH/FimT family pseudopilin [Psychrobium sp. nBUS_13]|uniref:GspH/FimT family pseudopilin n=1 Tax=Psychrobium sp. nBUS_13 TaxID=3395319 RepID=UPI003EBC1D01